MEEEEGEEEVENAVLVWGGDQKHYYIRPRIALRGEGYLLVLLLRGMKTRRRP